MHLNKRTANTTLIILGIIFIATITLSIFFPTKQSNLFAMISGWISGFATLGVGIYAIIINNKFNEQSERMEKEKLSLELTPNLTIYKSIVMNYKDLEEKISYNGIKYKRYLHKVSDDEEENISLDSLNLQENNNKVVAFYSILLSKFSANINLEKLEYIDENKMRKIIPLSRFQKLVNMLLLESTLLINEKMIFAFPYEIALHDNLIMTFVMENQEGRKFRFEYILNKEDGTFISTKKQL